jgi:uncharacterized protein
LAQDRFPLRINVGFLLNAPISTSREISFDLPTFKLGDDFDLKDLTGKVDLTRTPKGILVDADFSSSFSTECVRCLDEYDQKLHTAFTELYAFHGNSISDSGLIIADDANIDLLPLLREYLLVEVPISLLCREDCKGLCIECGENLNYNTCDHQAGEIRSGY